jgi:hypothetical protein
MATYKAPGADGVPAELLKYCSPQGRELLLCLCNLIQDRECIPHGWREVTLVSVPKSGDLTKCSNFRGITLLPTVTKLFTHLLLQRVRPHVQLNDHQYGFRRGRGTADALFALDATVRPRVQQGELACLAFLDWSKAYDRVMHHAFLDRLAYKGVSGKMWRLIDVLYQRCSARVSRGGCLPRSLKAFLSACAQLCGSRMPPVPFLVCRLR